MTIFIFVMAMATVVKNGIRVALVKNPNIALFTNAEDPMELKKTNLSAFNYTPFIGLYSSYENEILDERLFFDHFEFKVS